MARINHRARAKRLREVIDGESHVRDDYLVDQGVVLDERPVRVPERFACLTYSDGDTYIALCDSLEEARQHMADAPHNDSPEGPGDVHDLDTGAKYETRLHARLLHYTHRVSYDYDFGPDLGGRTGHVNYDVHGKRRAERLVPGLRKAGHTNITIKELP